MLVVSGGKMSHPVRLILLGFFMVLGGGIVLPYLMLPGVGVIPLTRIDATLAWIIPFGSYAVSVAGLFLGLLGSAYFLRKRRHPRPPSLRKDHSDPLSDSRLR
jgi:hypothetical protein